MGGGRHVSFGCEIDEKSLDFGFAHIFGVCLIVEEDRAPDPINVRLSGPISIVLKTQRIADLIE